MSNNLLNVIKEVFSTYNYSVSSSEQGFDLVAEKPGNRVGIKLVDDASADDVKTFLDGLKGNGLKVLFITMAGFGEDVKKLGSQREVMLWDRAELERQIGKAVLSGCDTSSPSARPDFSSLVSELYSRSTEEKAQAPPEEPAKKKARKPAETEGVSIPLHAVPVKLRDSDAVKISGAIGRAGDAEVTLKFIPFWKYDYVLDVQSKYRDLTIPLNSRGSRAINAITRQSDPAPAAAAVESVEVPDVPYNIEEAVVTQEEAGAMAIKNIIEENTKTVRFKGTQGEAAIVEHKKFQPKSQDIELSMELLYIPFWAVRSHKGYMEVNAYDGKPTKMPIDDGAEIL